MEFKQRKAAAMAALDSSLPDRSPKGSLDAPIAPLVAAINRRPSLFTTSSCSGRITILSHPHRPNPKKKAAGGSWLLVSHDPADPEATAALVFSAGPAGHLVFRFEPLIVAAECEDAAAAQWLVSKAISCGFRESGITNLGKRIMVGIRCSIRMEVPLGDSDQLMITPEYVKYLTRIANEKMEANKKRAEGFHQMLLQEELAKPPTANFEIVRCRKYSKDIRSRHDDISLMPSSAHNISTNGDAILFPEGLDEHDAKSVLASRNDKQFHSPSNRVALQEECNNDENVKDHYSGLNKDQLYRLDATNIKITGESVERLHLWGHSTCISNKMDRDCIFIFGGFGGLGRHARRNDILNLELESGLLTEIDAKGPPYPFLGHTCSVVGDRFFVIGGRHGPAEILDDVWVVDMRDFRWRFLKCSGSIFHPRHRHAAANVGTHIYVFGGLSNGVIYSCMHVLDTETLHWSEVNSEGEWPSARHSHSLVSWGSHLFLFGGYDGEKALGDFYSFNIETYSWKREICAGKAPFPRFSHCSFVYKNFLGILGGCPLKQDHQEIALLDLTHRVWKHIKIGSMGRGLWIRCSASVVADDLVVVGGGAACYAFGTKFNPPVKFSLLALNVNNDNSVRFCTGGSYDTDDQVTEFTNTKATKVKELSSHRPTETLCNDGDSDPDEVRKKDNSNVKPQFFMLQLEKKFAKVAKDLLKQFGWLDLGRKAYSNEDGSQISLPVTNAFVEKWTVCSLKSTEVMCIDDPFEYCQFKGLKVKEMSLSEALALLSAYNGSVINDEKPKIIKACKPPLKIMQDALSSLIVDRGLPQWLLQQLPTRWERLGDIVVLPVSSFKDPLWDFIREELWPIVAKSLNAHRLARQGRVLATGTRDSTLEILVGDNGWVTHHENGITYSFDATKCMFSAGNFSEKLRMSRIDCRSETVVDLFAGIGYFTLPFLVKSKAKVVYACEWNPHALEALRHNIQANSVANRCIVLEGDNRITAPKGVADRVCLGLLPSSEGSWATAVRALKNEGGILHLHGNVIDSDEQAWSELVVKSIGSISKSEGRCWDVAIQHLERVKWYGPHIRHVVADIRCKAAADI